MTSFSLRGDFHGPGWIYGARGGPAPCLLGPCLVAPGGLKAKAGVEKAFGIVDTMHGRGSGPRGSLMRVRTNFLPPGAPLVPVTMRLPLSNLAVALSR